MVVLRRPGAKPSVYKIKQTIILVEEDLMDLIEHLFSKAITTAAAGATTTTTKIIIVVKVLFGTTFNISFGAEFFYWEFSFACGFYYY